MLCRAHGLTIGLGKCEFAVPETEFLGHSLTSSGLHPLQKHTFAIRDFPPPLDKPGLQRFLRMITLLTDHKPLTHALFRSYPPWSDRQQLHLAYISKFTSNIIHIPGFENAVADTISRPSCDFSTPVFAVPLLSAVSLDFSATSS